jgi:hypothetical protein
MGKHSILLVQTRGRSTRTYYDFDNEAAAITALIGMFEQVWRQASAPPPYSSARRRRPRRRLPCAVPAPRRPSPEPRRHASASNPCRPSHTRLQRLFELNPNQPYLSYEPRDVAQFIDSMPHVGLLM